MMTRDPGAARILPLEGVELFTERGGRWYRLGEHLPAFGVPFRDGEDGVALDRLLIPGKLSAQRPDGAIRGCVACRPGARRAAEGSAGDGHEVLASGAARSGPSRRLRPSFLGCKGPGGKPPDGAEGDAEAFVLGAPGKLPLLAGERAVLGEPICWFRWDSGLIRSFPSGRFAGWSGPAQDDLVVLDEDGIELIARGAFKPLARAGIRLARGGFRGQWAGGRSARHESRPAPPFICRSPRIIAGRSAV